MTKPKNKRPRSLFNELVKGFEEIKEHRLNYQAIAKVNDLTLEQFRALPQVMQDSLVKAFKVGGSRDSKESK